MDGLKKWYKNLMFRNRVLFSLISVSLIPVIILGIFCHIQTKNLLIQREREVLKETMSQNVASLSSTLTSYKTVMDSLVWNDSLKKVLTTDYDTNFQMYIAYRDVIDPLILNIKGLNPSVDRITIYTSNDTLYPHGQNLMPLDQMKIPPEQLRDSKIHWYANDGDSLELYCRIYENSQGRQNVIYIKVNYLKTFEPLKELFGTDYGVLISDREHNTVFSYEKPDIVNETKIFQTGQYVKTEGEVSVSGWKLLLYRPQKIILASAGSITLLVIVVVLICVCMVVLISFSLSKSVVKPINELILNMDKIEYGRLSVDIQEKSTDEIGQLIQHFRVMVERLDYMVKEVYQSKIVQQEYEMKALQAQINPHFLYNSLSLINWKAIMADQEEISEMAQLLSTFYRTTLNRGKNITTVKGEWDNTCSYTRIQSIMHSGKLSIRMEIDQSILAYEMLNLLLQPLIENAIVHGLDHKETEGEKKLWVLGREEEGGVVFEICDNGCGMPEEVMESILTTETNGYGVQNVQHRIQLYYGKHYGLTYESKVGEGTRVQLRIPKVKKE